MFKYFDIAIVGGGAAGLCAAISSSRLLRKNNTNYKVALIDKSRILGKKILVTGNGKCNISNVNILPQFYYGNNLSGIKKIIDIFNYDDVKKFFNSLGIMLKCDSEGRVYPVSGQASSVKDIMLDEVKYLNIDKFCEFNIDYIKLLDKNIFEIKSKDVVIRSKKLIVCTGGKSAPFDGYDGDGYGYLRGLGHSIYPVFPALLPVQSDSLLLKQLKGVRWVSKVNLLADGKVVKSEIGEVQFNENNLSGICVFQLSRLVSEYFCTSHIFGRRYNNIQISLDLFYSYSSDDLETIMLNRAKKLKYMSVENFMAGIVNKKIGLALLKQLKILPYSKLTSNLKQNEIKSIVRLMKNLTFNISGVMDWRHSQVTAGGVSLDEFCGDTLESKKRNGLYCAGEILDVDGICGGYNLHWAWATGYIAGINAARSVIDEQKIK